MSLLTTIKSNKKTLLWIGGVALAIVALYMGYVYWRRNIKPKIISALPVSAADEIAYNDIVDIIKADNGGCSTTAGLSAILNKAGDDYTGNTVNAAWGHSKTGAIIGAVDYFYNNPSARPGGSGKLLYQSSWMTNATYEQCRDRWQQYHSNPNA